MPAPEGSVQGRFWSYRLLDCKPNKVPWLIGDDESLLDESVSDLLIVGEYNEGGEECNCCSARVVENAMAKKSVGFRVIDVLDVVGSGGFVGLGC